MMLFYSIVFVTGSRANNYNTDYLRLSTSYTSCQPMKQHSGRITGAAEEALYKM